MALLDILLRRGIIQLPKSYLNEFIANSQNPPGKDPVMRACYKATSKLLKEDPKFKDFISLIIAKRPLEPKHFVNLYFRSIQYLELFVRNNPDYPDKFTKQNMWKDELYNFMSLYLEEWKELLLKKDTTTTIYQRYAGPKIVLNVLFPQKPLRLADFGCGGNYGLPGISDNISFEDIVDKTSQALATKFVSQKVNLLEGLAVDKEDLYSPKSKAWRLACSFYPKELKNMPQVSAFERKIKDANRVRFLQVDLSQVKRKNGFIEKIPAAYFDGVILSTIMYQLSPREQKRVFKIAKESVNPKGLLVIQDFAIKDKKDPKKLDFNVNWFERPFTYRTFIAGKLTGWEIKELLQWQNGRCREVRPGKDFNQFLQHQSLFPSQKRMFLRL